MHKQQRWSSASATLGGIAWMALLLKPAWGQISSSPAELLFLLAPLVVVPLGFGLEATRLHSRQPELLLRLVRFSQPFGAALAVACFWVPAGREAATVAAGWLIVTVGAGLLGLWSFAKGQFGPPDEVCFNVGHLYLVVGGAWLVLSRLGAQPLGFKEPIVLLTAVHFHYAGFAALVLAGVVGKQLDAASLLRRRVFSLVALGLIFSPALLVAGFVFWPPLKVLAAFGLAASLAGLAAVSVTLLPRVRHKFARPFLVVSAGSVLVGVLLACVYSVGEFVGRPLIGIPEMTITHGVINGVGFVLCGLLAWTLDSGRPG